MSRTAASDDPASTTLARIDARARAGDVPALVALLRESDTHYRGLSTGEADRVRGHVYAALARCATDGDAALAIRAREDLRTSTSPIVLAGIARWLSRRAGDNGWRADLEAAARRIATVDRYPDFVFDPPATCCAPAKTALEELRAVLARLEGADASADAGRAVADDAPFRLDAAVCAVIVLEDQEGERVRLLDLIASRPDPRPVLMAFFYTRCMNPLKCSLTISRLGDALRSDALPPFDGHAISYDGDYDDPARLRGYGEDRRFPFSQQARLLRCVKGRQALKTAFDLQFGFGGFTVNNHARELFLLRPDGDGLRLSPELLARHNGLAEVLRQT